MAKTWKGKKRPNPIRHSAAAKRYRFSDAERDPEMLFLIERVENDARSNHAIAGASYLSPSTVSAMIDGKTRRPMNSTITFLANALGLKRAFIDASGRPRTVPIWQDRIDAIKEKWDADEKERKKNGS